jgi:hypothetical protein
VSTLDDVLASDALVRLIFELGADYFTLFHHVRFEFLTADGITDFADNFPYEHLNRDIWEHLIIRLKGIRDGEIEARRFAAPPPPPPIFVPEPEPVVSYARRDPPPPALAPDGAAPANPAAAFNVPLPAASA